MSNAVGNKLNVSRTSVKCRGMPLCVCVCVCECTHISVHLTGEHKILSSSQIKLLNQ